MKHTPGPWTLKEANSTIPVVGANGKTVASVKFRDNDYYDACLIASAPELLYILEELSSEIDAIMCGEHGKDWADHFNPLFEMLERANKAISKAEGR